MTEFFLITGCSGGGKSTLLAKLKDRGENVVEEPGRRIVAEELAGTGAALPWVDMAAFARRAIDVSTADLERARQLSGRVFFDRGLLDAALGLAHATGILLRKAMECPFPYSSRVFLAPPWPEIYAQDAERRHGFTAAVEEHDRIHAALADLALESVILPKVSVQQRADFVLDLVSGNGVGTGNSSCPAET